MTSPAEDTVAAFLRQADAPVSCESDDFDSSKHSFV